MVELLLDNLPHHEEKVKTGKRVVGYTTSRSGVIVSFEDGTVEEGSIIIGADGVWSSIRQQMNKLASADASVEPEFPYVSTYNSVFGRAAAIPSLEPGSMVQKHEPAEGGIGFNLFPTKEHVYFIAYRTCPETKKYVAFSQDDAEEFFKDFMDTPVINDVKVSDLWERRQRVAMTQLHYGVADKWYGDRAVLIGDNAHKVNQPILL
jgi:2-polyprenyl-6-methoxyphenol hydroxylase-like FAD-dependent oxidoreductase